jgi:DNA-binding transcriptional LysR family regulator
MVNPEWLRYFRVVAETRNLRVAAERLHVTHQALSHAIAKLEAYFGQTLLERGQRVRGLTPAGEVFLEEIRGVVDGLESLERRMAEFKSEVPRGPVRLAGVGPIHNYMVPNVLVDLLARFPDIRPQLYAMGKSESERWISAGEVDIGLQPVPPDRAELAWAPALSASYVIVGRPQPMRSWDEFSYVVPRLFGGGGGRVMDGWPDESFPRRVVAEVDQLEAALNLCEAGLGASFVPDLAVKSRLERGALSIVAEAPFAFTEQFYVVWRKGVRLTPAVREMLGVLRA